jgi:murein DD-endopeptidase MepM/ murein hydrolase activator NlpD
MSELDGAIEIDFPLRGEWLPVHSPGSRIPSHGTDMLAQRYAFDLLRVDQRKGAHVHPAGTLRTVVLGVPLEECYGYREPVHAPMDGEVVAAVDGVAERRWIHPVRELALVLKNGLTFDPKDGLQRLVGNHVITRSDGVHAAFVHMARGSVAVRVGQRVRVGDVLGRVGHSGNSTAPHLHFQLMDGPDPLTARGLPCRFRRYEVWRGGRWVLVEHGVPLATERMRSVAAEVPPGAMPLQGP